MEWNTVQLMIYGENLKNVEVELSDERLKVLKIYSTENLSYLFVDLIIPNNVEQDDYELIFSKDNEEVSFNYPIFEREVVTNEHKGFNNQDIVYLIFADRFCDGNPSNNTIGDSLDEFTSADLDGRKGGDIEGIISKLDYLEELGVTALWITPMLENNMWMSYHGYAATDLYKIDPRFGSNELYKQLVEDAHSKGFKIILDHVSNHIGINHLWIKNLPMNDWLNGSPENFINATHDKMAFLDIHGDSAVIKTTQQGWFQDYMPDLNQRNPFLKNYLIQNTLWWIEYSGIDGIREDTYPYNDQKYLSEWAEVILNEYPNFNIVGEVWQGTSSIISGYQTNSPVRKLKYDSNLPSVTDFALCDAIRSYLRGEKNIYPVYETLCQDFVYSNPDNLLVFIDNHDVTRAMLEAKGNVERIKIALNLLLFSRGIPAIFYGTEIGITGGEKHGELRQPFPGGFTGGNRDAFTKEGRSNIENELFDYLQELLRLRQEYPVLSKGKLKHILKGDVYYLFKTLEDETALIILNTGTEDFKLSELKSFLLEGNRFKNLKTSEEFDLSSNEILTLKGLTSEIFLVRK
jgi:glycosidase